MSLQHNAAQYDSRLPAWALPPPLMCLHFHPMAVSRWFSAASLKQVSNMAITGSGSLAIFLSIFVISAAFLPKGKFLCLVCLWCRITPSTAQARGVPGRSCRAFAREMRTSFPSNLSITFYCCDTAGAACLLENIHACCDCQAYMVNLELIERVLSWVLLQKAQENCYKK